MSTTNTSKIKIVRVITRLNVGGPATHAVLLNEGLNTDRYESILITGDVESNEADMSYLTEQYKGTIHKIPHLKRAINLRNDLKALWSMYYIMRKHKPVIVHTHTSKAGTLGRIAALLAGVPLRVHTFHGHTFHSYFNKLKTKIFITIEKILAHFTDKIVTVSHNVFDDICHKYQISKAKKFTIIPLGLELEPFANAESKKGLLRKELLIDDKTFLIGLVGRLIPVKNHKMLLDAAAKLKQIRTPRPFKFVIVGGGELEQELKQYADELNLENHIVFTGWRKDLDTIYADMDLVVLTSLNEGTPLSLIEAMAAKKPVIATDVGGVRDIVRNGITGYLVPSEDREEFTERIITFMRNKRLCSEMGQIAQNHALDRFSHTRLVSDTQELYDNLIRKKSC